MAPRRLVLTYYAVAAVRSEGFVYPVLNLYLLANDLSFGLVGLANGLFFAGMVAGEVPTGYVGDRFGRRASLAASAAGVTATMLGLAVAASPPAFLALFAFWGVVVTLRSGSGDAYLYDALDAHDATGSFTRVKGRATAAFLATSAVTSLVGGPLYARGHDLPFFAAAALTALGVPLVLALPAAGDHDATDGFSPRAALAVVRDRFATPPLRAFVLYTAAVVAVPETFDVLFQPIAVDAGLPTDLLGVAYAVTMGVTAAANHRAEWLRANVGVRGWFLAAPVALAVPLVAAVPVAGLAVPAFVLARVVKSLSYTLRGQFLNDRIDATGRATVLSAASMVTGGVILVARTAGGFLADAVGPAVALALLGAGLAAATGTAARAASPFRG